MAPMVRIVLLTLVLIGFVYAQEKVDKKAPTVITADKAEYYSKEKVAIYVGNVEVTKGNLYLKANNLKIFLSDKSDITKIIATGDVYFKQENKWGKSNEAEYIKDEDVIILKGNAEVHQDRNSVEGEIIYYYISQEKAVSTGQKERVRSVFFPKDKGER